MKLTPISLSLWLASKLGYELRFPKAPRAAPIYSLDDLVELCGFPELVRP